MLDCQVAPPKLVFTDPDDGFIAVCKLFLVDGIRDVGMLPENRVSVMTVYDHAIPDDDGIDNFILVYLTYQNLNLLLNQMLELPVETVLIPGEPFGFATLYLLFYTVLSELAAKLRDRKEKRGKRVK